VGEEITAERKGFLTQSRRARRVQEIDRLSGKGHRKLKDLFAYGTLMCDDIMRSVAGCALSHTHAVLRGYRRYAVRGEDYPALVAGGGGLVEGVLYHDIPDTAWLRLDRFEGEMYERRFVDVLLTDGRTESVYAYIIRPEFEGRLESTEWDFEAFLRSGKNRFETHYPGYGALK
jgi:gamma-glutamylcyclotransferase (GGCT)/AIG2-like uncharacterized protein YtfP